MQIVGNDREESMTEIKDMKGFVSDEDIQDAVDDTVSELLAINSSLRQRVKELEEKYELEGICGYIHGVEKPELHCKHVLWAKQYKAELASAQAAVEAMEKISNVVFDDNAIWSRIQIIRIIDSYQQATKEAGK
jgi:gamma-glutamyl:cysteine ligase YbdK (ATP-grasp superfamily)